MHTCANVIVLNLLNQKLNNVFFFLKDDDESQSIQATEDDGQSKNYYNSVDSSTQSEKETMSKSESPLIKINGVRSKIIAFIILLLIFAAGLCVRIVLDSKL